MLTNIILVVYIMLTAFQMYDDSSKKKRVVVLGCKVLLNAAILILGSFSDELAVVAILLIANIYYIVKRKNIEICVHEWLIYAIECELIGILTIIDIVHTVSFTYECFI